MRGFVDDFAAFSSGPARFVFRRGVLSKCGFPITMAALMLLRLMEQCGGQNKYRREGVSLKKRIPDA